MGGFSKDYSRLGWHRNFFRKSPELRDTLDELVKYVIKISLKPNVNNEQLIGDDISDFLKNT